MKFWNMGRKEEVEDSQFRTDQYESDEGIVLNYRIFIPEEYHPEKAYPVVLFFHGAGERGDDNTAQLKWGVKQFALDSIQSRHPSIIIAPQCPANSWWTGNQNWRSEDLQLNEEPVSNLQISIDLLGDIQEQYSVDSTRLYVTGISMGGFATWAAIMHFPDLFAAAVPVCGGGDTANAHTIKDIPVWAFHGAKDEVVPPELSREMIQALHKAGGNPGYTEYPDIDHSSWILAYQEPYLYEWLFKQQKDDSDVFEE